MKIQRLLIDLTAVNLGLLFLLAQLRPAETHSVAPVLRGRALEIVDDRGRVRASITVQPADQKVRRMGSICSVVARTWWAHAHNVPHDGVHAELSGSRRHVLDSGAQAHQRVGQRPRPFVI